MAFGDAAGPPANHRQLAELLELLEAAGHHGYRDARGPMGFTQRQAAGKFTGPEADEFIERLQSEIHGDGPPVDSRPPPPARAPRPDPPTRRRVGGTSAATASESTPTPLSDVPTEDLAAELQRRGWVVLEP